MNLDREVEETISAGERNRETMQLVQNWCGYARLRKFGGTGLIELETGLPIGHHSLECDHAAADSIACWDLRDAVLDFYDRHCSTCQKRKPIRFPNILSIIAERDRKREEQGRQETLRIKNSAEARRRRAEIRESLKKRLDPVGQAIVEDIGAFDGDRSAENRNRLVESASLAPERFPPDLVEHVFQLSEEEHWFSDVGIAILAELNVDTARLVSLAMATLARQGGQENLVEILLRLVQFIDADSVGNALPALIELAKPDDRGFRGIADRRVIERPELLQALWSDHRKAILNGLGTLLQSRRRELVELAGRGLSVLQEHDSKAMLEILEPVAFTFVRADSLIDDIRDDDDPLPALGDALVTAFRNSPDEVASTLDCLAQGSASISRVRVFMVYARALRVRERRQDTSLPSDPRPLQIAFSCLLWVSTTDRDGALLQIVLSAFGNRPGNLVTVAREEIDSLLGAAFVLADHLEEIDSVSQFSELSRPAPLERRSSRLTLTRLISIYLDWAAIAARGDGTLTARVAQILDDVPENREELRGLALGIAQHFSDDLESLQRILPHLYQGLVGPSVIVRSYAATALGKLPRDSQRNVPKLVFEAFCVLLSDPHVIVHQAAVRVLPRLALPPSLRRHCALATLNVVDSYRSESGQDWFLIDCVGVVAGMLDEFREHGMKVRSHLVEILMGTDPQVLSQGLWSLSRRLKDAPSFVRLVVRTLPYLADDNDSNDMAEILDELGPEAVNAHATELKEAGLAVAHENFWLSAQVLETLAQAGEATLARRFADEVVEVFDDTEHCRARKTAARFLALAAAIEDAIETNNREQLADRVRNWKENEKERDIDEKKQHERNSRAGLPFSD